MTRLPTMARVVRTPTPPYDAVTTTTELSPGYDGEAHPSLAVQLYVRASAPGGFLRLEAFFDDGAWIAGSYWESLAAIERWRNDPPHGAAKRIAKAQWFGATITRIARLEADYGFNLEGPGRAPTNRRSIGLRGHRLGHRCRGGSAHPIKTEVRIPSPGSDLASLGLSAARSTAQVGDGAAP